MQRTPQDSSPLPFGNGPQRRNGQTKLLHDANKESIKSWERVREAQSMTQGMLVRRPGLLRLKGRNVMTVTEVLSAFWEARIWTVLMRSGVVMARSTSPLFH